LPRTKQDDGNGMILIGAGILATILGAIGTFVLSNNGGGGNRSNGKSHNTIAPAKKPCGCGMKKH
jgi:hypothetical protein